VIKGNTASQATMLQKSYNNFQSIKPQQKI